MNLTGKMSSRVWALTSVLLFFAIALISLIPLFAAHTETTAIFPLNTTFVQNNTLRAFNFSVSWTGGVDNITRVNITLPSSFVLGSFGNLSGAGFFCTNVSASLINCTNSSANGLNPAAPSVIIQVNATPQVATGVYNWTINTTDTAAAINGSIVSTSVDGDVPYCSAFSANASYARNGEIVNFTATCTDVGSGVSTVFFNLTAVNPAVGLVAASPGGGNSYYFAAAVNAGEGAQTAYIFNVSDIAGNLNSSLAPPTSVVVDNINPSVSGASVNVTAARTGTPINVSAVIADANLNASRLFVYNSTGAATPMLPQGGNVYTAFLTVAEAGNNPSLQYNISAYDNASNVNNTIFVSFILDNSAPLVTAPITAYTGAVNYVKSGQTIRLNATVTDVGPAGIAGVTVNGSNINASGSIPLVSDGNTYLNLTVAVGPGVTTGSKPLLVTATDNASNVNNSVSFTVAVDNTNPNVTFAANDTTLRPGFSVFFTAVVSDADSGPNLSSVFVINSTGGLWQLNTTDNTTFNGTVVVTEAGDTTYLFNLTVSDNVGNVNSTQTVNITVDNTPPVVTAQSTIYPPAQTAAKQNQPVNVNVTINAGISGLASATVNASALGLANADSVPLVRQGSSNNYNVTLLVNITTPNATLYLPVTAIDNSSNVNSTTSLTVIVDNTHPAVAALQTSYPGIQTQARTNQTITLNANVSDVGSGVYSVTADGSQIGIGTIPLLFNGVSYVNSTVVIGASTTGIKNLTVTATDNASNTNTTATLQVIVDNTNPVVPYFNASDLTVKSSDPVFFTAVVNDTNSGLNLSSVFVLNSTGGATQLNTTDNTTFNGTVVVTEASDNTYNYNITVSDNVGNANSTRYVTLTVDNTRPNVTANPATYPAGQTYAKSGDNVTLNATVTDNLAGVASVTVNASALGLGSSLALTGAGTGYTRTVQVNTTNNGTVTLLVTATDNSGNVNSTISLSVNIDSTNPVVTANSPAYPGIQTWVKNGQNITLNSTVTDSPAAVKTVTVNSSALGGAANLTLVKDGSTDFYNNTLTVSGVASDGAKSLLVTATDNANNINNTVSLSVNVDVTNPVVTITSPANAANVSGTYTITLTVNDTSSGVNVSSIALYVNNAAQARACTGLGTFANCSFSWDTTGASDGTYIMNATALDNATNPGVSTQVTVTVDNTAPTLTVNSPVGGQTITDTLSVNASVSDTRLNASSCKYKVTNATSTILDWTSLSYSGGYCTGNVSAKSFPVGAQTVFVNVSDILGNLNSTNVSISSAAGIWVNSVTATKSTAYTTGSDYLEYTFNVTLKGGTKVKLKLSPLTDGTNTYTPEGQATITSNSSTYNVQQNYTGLTGIVPVSGLFTLRYNVPSGMVAGAYTANYGVGLYS